MSKGGQHSPISFCFSVVPERKRKDQTTQALLVPTLAHLPPGFSPLPAFLAQMRHAPTRHTPSNKSLFSQPRAQRKRLPLCHLLHFSHPLLNSSARDHVRRRGPGQATSSCASCDMDQAGKKDAQKEKTSAASKAQHKKQGRALSCRSGHHLQRGSLSNQDTHPHAPCAPPLAREAAKPNACPHAFCGS